MGLGRGEQGRECKIKLEGGRQSDPEGPSRSAVPNILAPGAGFVEDDFSTDGVRRGDGLGMVQMHYMQAHLLLCDPMPNRPSLVPAGSLDVGDHYSKSWGGTCRSHVKLSHVL